MEKLQIAIKEKENSAILEKAESLGIDLNDYKKGDIQEKEVETKKSQENVKKDVEGEKLPLDDSIKKLETAITNAVKNITVEKEEKSEEKATIGLYG